jgi:uncharacterized protein YndB with AHSA1/START domain
MSAIRDSFETSSSTKTAFDAVATQAGIRAWWCKDCEVADHIGGHNELNFVKNGIPVQMKFQIAALDRDRVIWRCTDNPNPAWRGSQIAWEIKETAQGARLEFCHDGFAGGGPDDMTREGWQHFMSSLEAHINGAEGSPW